MLFHEPLVLIARASVHTNADCDSDAPLRCTEFEESRMRRKSRRRTDGSKKNKPIRLLCSAQFSKALKNNTLKLFESIMADSNPVRLHTKGQLLERLRTHTKFLRRTSPAPLHQLTALPLRLKSVHGTHPCGCQLSISIVWFVAQAISVCDCRSSQHSNFDADGKKDH